MNTVQVPREPASWPAKAPAKVPPLPYEQHHPKNYS